MISVFFSFILSCLVLSSLSSSLLSLSLSSFSVSFSLSIFLSFSLSPCTCDVCCCVYMWCLCGVCVCLCVWCGVVCAVWCGTLKTPVCRLKTPPCVHSKRPVYAGNTRTCVETCTRGAGTHGDVLNVHTESVFKSTHGGHRQFCLPRKAHAELVLTWPHRFTKVTTGFYKFQV